MFDRVEGILNCQSDDLVELSKAAGLEPRNFLLGAELINADLRGMNLSEFDVAGAKFSKCLINEGTVFQAAQGFGPVAIHGFFLMQEKILEDIREINHLLKDCMGIFSKKDEGNYDLFQSHVNEESSGVEKNKINELFGYDVLEKIRLSSYNILGEVRFMVLCDGVTEYEDFDYNEFGSYVDVEIKISHSILQEILNEKIEIVKLFIDEFFGKNLPIREIDKIREIEKRTSILLSDVENYRYHEFRSFYVNDMTIDMSGFIFSFRWNSARKYFYPAQV